MTDPKYTVGRGVPLGAGSFRGPFPNIKMPPFATPGALEAATLAERARVVTEIVAWLADDAAKTNDELRKLHARKKLTPLMTAEWEALIAAKSGIAAEIKRKWGGAAHGGECG